MERRSAGGGGPGAGAAGRGEGEGGGGKRAPRGGRGSGGGAGAAGAGRGLPCGQRRLGGDLGAPRPAARAPHGRRGAGRRSGDGGDLRRGPSGRRAQGRAPRLQDLLHRWFPRRGPARRGGDLVRAPQRLRLPAPAGDGAALGPRHPPAAHRRVRRDHRAHRRRGPHARDLPAGALPRPEDLRRPRASAHRGVRGARAGPSARPAPARGRARSPATGAPGSRWSGRRRARPGP